MKICPDCNSTELINQNSFLICKKCGLEIEQLLNSEMNENEYEYREKYNNAYFDTLHVSKNYYGGLSASQYQKFKRLQFIDKSSILNSSAKRKIIIHQYIRMLSSKYQLNYGNKKIQEIYSYALKIDADFKKNQYFSRLLACKIAIYECSSELKSLYRHFIYFYKDSYTNEDQKRLKPRPIKAFRLAKPYISNKNQYDNPFLDEMVEVIYKRGFKININDFIRKVNRAIEILESHYKKDMKIKSVTRYISYLIVKNKDISARSNDFFPNCVCSANYYPKEILRRAVNSVAF